MEQSQYVQKNESVSENICFNIMESYLASNHDLNIKIFSRFYKTIGGRSRRYFAEPFEANAERDRVRVSPGASPIFPKILL
jgi:hypothetical protein